MARLPGPDARVRFLDVDGTAKDVASPCAGPTCLRTTPDVIAVLRPDGQVWLSTADDRAGRVVQPGSPGVPIVAFDRPSSWRVPGTVRVPTLPPELRTCGQSVAGGGVGWHIIRNAGDVWQRIDWVVPPTDPAVLALPKDAYPLAASSGKLCAFGRQRAERQWDIHHVATGRMVAAVPDREHAPARCVGEDGTVAVDLEDETVVLGPDGRETRTKTAARAGPPSVAEVGLSTPALIHQPGTTLSIRQADGSRTSVALDANQDLDGQPLPPGTTRTRLATSGDGKTRLLVAERLQFADCSERERLFVMDIAGKTTTRLVDDDVVILRASFAAERFVWVEASPTWVNADAEGLGP